jgi:hypothetical protein
MLSGTTSSPPGRSRQVRRRADARRDDLLANGYTTRKLRPIRPLLSLYLARNSQCSALRLTSDVRDIAHAACRLDQRCRAGLPSVCH